jgi:competence protein ComEC
MLLISICLAWLVGICLGSYWHLPSLWIICGLLPITSVFFFKQHRKQVLILALALVAFVGGLIYYPISLPKDILAAADYGQTEIEIQGIVGGPPEIKDKTTHLDITVQTIDGHPASGRVLLFVSHYPEYRYGDTILAKGRLSSVPILDGFDYQAYMAREGIYATMLSPFIQLQKSQSGFSLLAWIYSFRQKLAESLAAALPEPQAGLAQGTILGIRASISPQLQDDLSITGTAHLIAISGINLSIITGIIVALGIRIIGRRHYYYVWIALIVIWFYTILAGWQSPVIRAAIMASVFLLAEFLGRQKMALPALMLSATVMIGLDPQVLWSISFQLSFLAMAGLILITPIFQNLARDCIFKLSEEDSWSARLILPVTDSFAVSLGSVLAIWPVVAYNFGIVSLVGPLTTFLISPALTGIIILCSLTALIGLVSIPIAQVAGWLSWLFLSYMLVVIQAFAALPLIAVQTGSLNINFVRLYYGCLTLGLIIRSNYHRAASTLSGLTSKMAEFEISFSQAPKKYIIVPLLVAAFVTSSMASTLPDSRLHVSFLDVGEGDSILIQSSGQNVLVDGGPSPQAVNQSLSSKIPFWNRNIEMVILTHPHLDHLSGLIEVIKRYQVRQILVPNSYTDNPFYLELLSIIKEKNIKTVFADKGQIIVLGNGSLIEILNPVYAATPGQDSDFESQGIVLKVSQGQYSFLLTADVESETELRLIKDRVNLDCTVLKVAHHGSSTSTSADFLSACQPQFAVISSGLKNPFGHPAPVVLEHLAAQTVFRTDICGTIEFTTDGWKIWAKTER